MFDNIPSELKALRQWVSADYSDKIPLNPVSGARANVTDPSTWGTFEQAVQTGKLIGFVLTSQDPYTVIDLDNKLEDPATPAELELYNRILEAFPSYTEVSASGRGVHIVIRGQVRSAKRGHVEVYSSARYMIFTGNVLRTLPIADCRATAESLVGEMRPAAEAELVEKESKLSDEDLFSMAMNAANGEKFDLLCRGDWSAMGYPSQSEADFALLAILAFYTEDNEQVRRLFRYSGLGRRDKATRNNDYLNRALRKIRGNQAPEIDLSNLKSTVPTPDTMREILGPRGFNLAGYPWRDQPPPPPKAVVASSTRPATNKTKNSCTFPPGLIGEMADYIFRSAVRPIPEVSLAAAIALTSGIAGRCYNISGSGLNQYIILLASTGAGKDGATSGIDRILTAIKDQIPAVDQFIGPAVFASGQALIKVLDDRPSFLSVLAEFGYTIQQLCDPRAHPSLLMLKRVWLDLYSKSGWESVLRSSVYSDKEKNTKAIHAPNVAILGESTPEAFFERLSADHIADGLLPRFSLIEYTGKRPARNRNCKFAPEPGLKQKLVELAGVSLTHMQNQRCVLVQSTAAGMAVLDEFDEQADNNINNSLNEVDRQLWTRAHLKAIKLAALVAVGVNPNNPVIDKAEAEWTVDFITREVEAMASRFRMGDVGVGDHRHENDIRRAVEAYLEMDSAQRLTYRAPKSILGQPIIPYHYLRRRCRLLTTFRTDRRGTAKALDDSLKDMVKADILRLIPIQQCREKYNVNSELYVLGTTW